MKELNPERNFGVDLLKTVAMYFVVVTHLLNLGGIIDVAKSGGATYWTVWTLRIAAYCCVNCFAMATGYLMVNRSFKYRKIISLWVSVVFYLVIITAIYACFFTGKVSLTWLPHIFMPVTYSSYWYFSSYFVLFFFIPYINILLNSINKRQYIILVLTGFVLFSLSYIFKANQGSLFGLQDGFSPIWLMYMYIVGAGIKLHNLFLDISSKKAIVYYLICILATMLTKLVIHYTSAFDIPLVSNFASIYGENRFINYISPTIVGEAIFLMVVCVKSKTNTTISKCLKKIAPSLFFVYIIHMHFLIAENFIENKFRFLTFHSPLVMTLEIFIIALGIFAICIGVDVLRRIIFQN